MFGLGLPRLHSSICLISLWLSALKRPARYERGRKAGTCGTCLCTGPHGVAHVLIYPCGKAWKNPPFPSRFIVSDRSSPSRVRFAASRPGLLRADPKGWLFMRGKGGVGPWGARAGR